MESGKTRRDSHGMMSKSGGLGNWAGAGKLPRSVVGGEQIRRRMRGYALNSLSISD